ncbi:lasso peptide biosynthesis PqqD family chaperone [Kutzneria kofuensis]|uniref:Coenzyme PQQ synthesis protein D (PqqD) n=1 Tax=Kutzneria kofuensis TaxID=103725 RepID=A0A7W9NL70_9PSEU|nr:lasso peptide biosynthesis PqqD family chaperone [Kutzneria kofuensis]MBB5896454.1 hypothetical protein [Kutzneria kofuensis]
MPLRLHPDVAHTATDDGAVLLDQNTGRYWQLNATGSGILDAVLGGRAVDQVVADLAARHAVEPDRVRRDVTGLLDRLRTAGLVQGAS